MENNPTENGNKDGAKSLQQEVVVALKGRIAWIVVTFILTTLGVGAGWFVKTYTDFVSIRDRITQVEALTKENKLQQTVILDRIDTLEKKQNERFDQLYLAIIQDGSSVQGK